jgi:hypothetical protein
MNVMLRWTAVLKRVPCDSYLSCKPNQHHFLIIIDNPKVTRLDHPYCNSLSLHHPSTGAFLPCLLLPLAKDA